jgi:predicted DNA-binding transcriptional regulator AlpA
MDAAFFCGMLEDVRTRQTTFSEPHKGAHSMTAATQSEPALMTKKQLAEFLQCSQRQCEILTSKGRLPKPIYLGQSSPRWKRADVLAHLEAVQQ